MKATAPPISALLRRPVAVARADTGAHRRVIRLRDFKRNGREVAGQIPASRAVIPRT